MGTIQHSYEGLVASSFIASWSSQVSRLWWAPVRARGGAPLLRDSCDCWHSPDSRGFEPDDSHSLGCGNHDRMVERISVTNKVLFLGAKFHGCFRLIRDNREVSHMSTVVVKVVCVQGSSCPHIDCVGKSMEIQGAEEFLLLIDSKPSMLEFICRLIALRVSLPTPELTLRSASSTGGPLSCCQMIRCGSICIPSSSVAQIQRNASSGLLGLPQSTMVTGCSHDDLPPPLLPCRHGVSTQTPCRPKED